jgi:predicted ABC-type ATPase
MFAGPNGSGKTSLVRKLAKEFSPEGLFQLHHFINADELHLALSEGRGIALDLLQRDVSTEEVRTALLAGGRLSPDHPFLKAVQVQGGRLSAPAVVCDGYVAAALADFLRDGLFAAGQSFAFETVMSHRSKTDFFAKACASGYRTYLYFIATDLPSLNVERVKNRVALGGHSVPEEKIQQRYDRCLQLVPEAIASAYRAFLFDNTGPDPVWLAQRTPEGEFRIEAPTNTMPTWFRRWVEPLFLGGP